MQGQDEGVINLKDSVDAVQSRLLPGAQIVYIGSPWAPRGMVYQAMRDRHGKPGKDLAVFHAQAPWLNPFWWTEDRIAEIRDDPRKQDAYRADVLAQFLDSESSMFPHEMIQVCTDIGVRIVDREPGYSYAASMDPATRGNAWALCVMSRKGLHRRQVLAREWQGTASSPLDPDHVFAEIAATLEPYGLQKIITDQWATDALKAVAKRHGLRLIEAPWRQAETVDAYLQARDAMRAGTVRLLDNTTQQDDLTRVKKITTTNGHRIELPRTTDGRHCDSVPPLVRLISYHVRDFVQPEPPRGTEERQNYEEQLREQREIQQHAEKEKKQIRKRQIRGRKAAVRSFARGKISELRKGQR